ncbi:hypothetical protein [Francisella frigiditurris]|uniref:Uncharacterized protein n=1 Tax=Francisella frigiditurris TaxID=1542390 RepID=A0A1J0KRZ2_9GAMM|nr:hypothetical protein [Francisella frigiditurris]APC96422.1 hypothetical protein KX01_441 [Francisella frigiditurris]
MVNYVIAFFVATIIYLIVIGYVKNLFPISKFLKLVIYICISTVSLPAVNYVMQYFGGSNTEYTSEEFSNDQPQTIIVERDGTIVDE